MFKECLKTNFSLSFSLVLVNVWDWEVVVWFFGVVEVFFPIISGILP